MNVPIIRRWLALVVIGTTISACATTGAGQDAAGRDAAGVLIEPGATATHLTFRILTASYLFGISVTTCTGAKAMWVIGTSGTATPVSTITYGEVPKGFAEHSGPLPLTPGCYQVTVSNAAPLRFTVDKDGSIAAAR